MLSICTSPFDIIYHNLEQACGQSNETVSAVYRPTSLRLNKYYLNVIVWSNFFLMGVFPFMILFYLNVCILKKLMVRSTWATKSMKKNNESWRYLNRRFVNEHKCSTVSESNEEVELELVKSSELISLNNGSLKQRNKLDRNGSTNCEVKSYHEENVCSKNAIQGPQHSNKGTISTEKCEGEKQNSRIDKKTIKKIMIDHPSIQQTPKRSCMKEFGGERKSSITVSIEVDEDHNSSRQCQPRIHTSLETNRGRNVVELAWVTLVIVFIFMICHSIKWIANFYEMIMVISISNIKRVF